MGVGTFLRRNQRKLHPTRMVTIPEIGAIRIRTAANIASSLLVLVLETVEQQLAVPHRLLPLRTCFRQHDPKFSL